MRSTKWIPIVEDKPKLNQVILLEFGGNEYLGPPHHKVVLPAYLEHNTTLDEYNWIIFSSSIYSPFFPATKLFDDIDIISLSSTHIWTDLPLSSCEMVY